jgi:hypothetical protein
VFYTNDDWMPKGKNLYIMPIINDDKLLLHSKQHPERVLDTLRIKWVGCSFNIDQDLLMKHIEDQEFICVHDFDVTEKYVDFTFDNFNAQNIKNKDNFQPFMKHMIWAICHKSIGFNIVNTILPKVLRVH